MSRIRSKDTKPELKVRKLLHGAGYRFRIHFIGAPGRPDIAFTAKRKLIQVQGCFWHDHQGCSGSRNPKSNSEYWTKKLARNRERDRRHADEARALGWELIVVWECELKDDAALKARLIDFLGHPCAAYPTDGRTSVTRNQDRYPTTDGALRPALHSVLSPP